MSEDSRTLEILDKLIAFPTVSKDSNLDLLEWVENLLRKGGFDVTRIWSPDRRKAGLFARIGPGTDKGVCLSAHTDVVPVDGQDWTRAPFRLTRANDRVFGRGTTDMKGFLASALHLAEQAASASLQVPLSLVISYDEEVGCIGIRQMLPELEGLIGTPDAVIVGEPTSMQIAVGHKGKAALRATCHGQSGHSALAPQFVNAIHVAGAFISEIRALQDALATEARDPAYDVPYSTVHIGRIEGGRALNIVPDFVSIDFECRHLPQTNLGSLRDRIDAAGVRALSGFAAPPAAIEIEEINAYPGLDVAADAPMVPWLQAIAQSRQTTKVAFGTEAGFFAALGLPTAVVGPGDMSRDGHKPDEGLDLAELARCDRMMNRILDHLTGHELRLA